MKEEMVGVKLTLSTDNTNGNVSTAQARIMIITNFAAQNRLKQ